MNAWLYTLSIMCLLTSICSVLEFLWPAHRPSLKNILFNLASGAFALSALLAIQMLLTPFWARLRDCAFFPNALMRLPPSMKWAAALAALFAWDFFQYWAHRAQHRFHWLWRFHRLHHSDRDVSGSTSHRNHLVNHLANLVCISIPFTLLFPTSPIPAWCTFVFFWCYGYFNHTRMPISLGPLTPLLSGPQFHRIHHGIATAHHDKNFAAFFPVLDILFGTYYKPQKNEIVATGVDDGLPANSLAIATIQPLTAFWQPAPPPSSAHPPLPSYSPASQISNPQI